MRFSAFFKEIAADRKGATAIEYGLIVAFLAVSILGAMNAFADEAIAMWTDVESEMVAANQ